MDPQVKCGGPQIATPYNLIDLGSGVLAIVLQSKALSVKDVMNAAQACKALRDAAENDSVWRAKALVLYPEATVRLAGHYATYKELLADDNAFNASLVLTLVDASCDYKDNRRDYYVECLLLELQWDRADQVFRLFIDARGEPSGLRNAVESSLGATVHRGCASRRAVRAEVTRLEAARSALQEAVDHQAAHACSDPDAAARHRAARRVLTLTTARLVTAARDLQEGPPLSFIDLLSVIRPRPGGHRFVDTRPGHHRGYLEFEGLHRVDSLVAELPETYAAKSEAAANGLDIVFCYANPVPVMPHAHMVDFHGQVLVTVPPGESLLGVFRRHGRYEAHDAPLRRMEDESPEEQRQRWGHVPADVLQRRDPPWYVE